MSNRLDVMLTSRRADGVWTWRAAGARQPKGVLEPELLPAGAAVGDVLRVEAEVTVDGISVRQVLPAKADRPAPARVEHIGGQQFTEGVTGPARLDKEGGDRPSRRRGDGGRARRDGGGGRGRRDDRRPQRSGSGQRGGREDRPRRAPRLRSGSDHRDAWLATLGPERRAVAERLANEGIRAVRQAIEEESASAAGEEAKESGGGAEARLALVEEVFTELRAADWRDRAEAARGVCDDVELRDLRSVVAGTPQDIASDELRGLADELRTNLAARVDREHSAWIADLGSLLRKGRVITALRVSQRPPKTGTPLPESLAETLQSAAASQLDEDAEDDLWVRMLEAAAQSPIRLVLVAGGVPAEPSERLLRTVRRFGDRLPALRAQFAEHLEPAAEPEPPAADTPAEAEAEPPAAGAPVEVEPEPPAPEVEPEPPAVEVEPEPPAAEAEPEPPAAGAPVEPEAEPPAAGAPVEVEPEPPAPEAEPEPPAVEVEPEPPAAEAEPGDAPAEVAAAEDPSADGVADADVAEEISQAAGEVEVV